MSNAWENFKSNNEKNKLIKPHDRVLAAVSGGPDSVAMLHLLWRLKKTMRFELAAAYVNHGLRKNAAREVKFVMELCQRLGLACFVVNIPVKKFAKDNKISIETSARDLRYSALCDLGKENKFNKIATGHNSNDNAETVLMWLLRGTGAEGLSGIPLQRVLKGKITTIRPILPIPREEIESYLLSQNMKYKVDESNFSLDYTRNKIRHKLMPLLKNINPGVVEHLYNLSRTLALQNEFIAVQINKFKKRSLIVKSNRIELDLKGFIGYNKLLQGRLLKDILPEKRSQVQVERILNWILFSPSKETVLSHTWRLKKINNRLIFEHI